MIVYDSNEVTKEFPGGKEAYCPRCYFEDDKRVLQSDCPGHNHKNTDQA